MNTEEEKQEILDAENTASTENNDTPESDNQNQSEGENTEDETQEEELDPLKKAELENNELQDKFLRLAAEFENFRKRTIKEKTELILNGAERTVDAILPVVDDMERALSGAENSNDVAALKEGMDLIFKKITKALEGLGVKKIETEGKDFDTDYHEAVAMVPGVDDEKKGKVIDCIQTGYTLNDKVIRHAKVAVGQ